LHSDVVISADLVGFFVPDFISRYSFILLICQR
jgi:hypothetical protein